MPTLDRPDRPDSSPNGGFFIQSRAGRVGNFEVVIPWPDGGLAHFFRDNDAPSAPWHGPTLFGSGSSRYEGVSLIESDFKAFGSPKMKNLEVIAVNGQRIEHWWRENGGELLWRRASDLPILPARGVPALAYTGAIFLETDLGLGIVPDRDAHGPSRFYVAAALAGTGLGLGKRENAEDGVQQWKPLHDFLTTTPIPRPGSPPVDHFGDADSLTSTAFPGGVALR